MFKIIKSTAVQGKRSGILLTINSQMLNIIAHIGVQDKKCRGL